MNRLYNTFISNHITPIHLFLEFFVGIINLRIHASTNRITIIVDLNGVLISKNNVNNIIKKPIIYRVSLKLCFIMHASIIIYFSNNAAQDSTIV